MEGDNMEGYGDRLASGARSATFAQGEKITQEKWDIAFEGFNAEDFKKNGFRTKEKYIGFSFQAVLDGYWEFYHDDDCGAVLDPNTKICSACGWRPDMQSMGARRVRR